MFVNESWVQINRGEETLAFNACCLLLSLHILAQADHVMVHSDQDKDVVTGLKQKTNYGRPDWNKEFEEVRKENPT